jgi:hypothetical protein
MIEHKQAPSSRCNQASMHRDLTAGIGILRTDADKWVRRRPTPGGTTEILSSSSSPPYFI